MLSIDPGLGKTVTVLTAVEKMIAEKRAKGKLSRCLVLAPTPVVENVWRDEHTNWSHLKHLRVRIAMGPPSIRYAALTDPNAHVVAMNYENLVWAMDKIPRGKFPFDILVLDEAEMMKTPSSARFRRFRYRVTEFDVRIVMSGTLIPNHPKDIWAPSYLMTAEAKGGGVYDSVFGGSFEAFVKEHFEVNAYTRKVTPRDGAIDKMTARLQPYVFEARKEDWLDLPPLQVVNRYYDMPKKARDEYREFEKEMLLELERGGDLGLDAELDLDEEGDTAVALNAAVLKNKLRQLCSGFLYVENARGERRAVWRHRGKIDAYKGLRAELGSAQLLTVYGYIAECEKFGLQNRLGSTVKASVRKDLIDRWNAGTLQDLALHPRSGGHGLNLQKSNAHHIAMLTLPWSPGLYDQVIARLHRMGQTNPVVVHRLIARDTVEEDVVEALRSKGEMQQAIYAGLRRRLDK